MKKCWLLILLLLLPVVAADKDILMAERIKVKTTLSSELNFVETGAGSLVDTANIQLYLFPLNDERSTVESLDATPDAVEKEDHLLFSWKKPKGKVGFNVEGVTETFGRFIPVRTKIPFPMKNLPNEVKEFTQAAEIIDADHPTIVRKANELAAGEDDAYVVAYKIGKWIQDNVDYSLDSLTADVSQPSSWVMKNKKGVCDEITSLFIAMLRAVGIPGRFVSGVAYTDYNDLNDFGPHAWAEVYFPGIGWVGFDITYGEYGYVDAPHIKLKENVDADDISTRFQWRGVKIDAEASELGIDNEILELGERVKPLLDVKARVLKKAVGFDSFNLVEAIVENPNDYYVITDLSITKNNNIENMDFYRKVILLRPKEKKKYFWKIRLTGKLSEGFLYTIPIMVYTTRNASSTVDFEVASNNPYYGLAEITSYVNEHDTQEEKVVQTDIDLECVADKQEILLGEKIAVTCEVSNKGNVARNVEVCLDQCKSLEVGIAQKKQAEFEKELDEVGEKTITVTMGGQQEDLSVLVFDKAGVSIINVDAPDQVRYDDEFPLIYSLKKSSFADVNNIRVEIESATKTSFSVENLKDIINMDVKLRGSDIINDEVLIT
ncbi:MAG: transglutaminase-like domain-containing protein, partial [Candidatus Woesearchaeota archaeon]|nr:transglutaminase-like domain-containing protein [Candidatus Woesearchaeota archaeon]